MIQWVYETTRRSKVDRTIVATEDQRIHDCVFQFGGECVMTSADHLTGTDRVAEVVRGMDVELVMNVQGDEPLIPTSIIDSLVEIMLANESVDMGTIVVPIKGDSSELGDPNVVKVVLDKHNFALYFSRASIPFIADPENLNFRLFKHWGIYAFRKHFLEKFVNWPQGQLERAEKLEQLRALENGTKILVSIATGDSVAVDTPDDVKKVEALLTKQH